MKSCAVTFQSKILYQQFHMVLFTTEQVLTFESLDEIQWCRTTQMKCLQQLFYMVVFAMQHWVLTLHSVQRANEVVIDSPGLVDFAIGLVNSVLNLPDGQVNF